MTDERDIHRSENEGMPPMDIQQLWVVYGFLSIIRQEFVNNHSFRHFEDAAKDLVERMDEEGKKKYHGLQENLPFLIDSFLGPAGSEKWKELERDRIMEFEEYDSEGVG